MKSCTPRPAPPVRPRSFRRKARNIVKRNGDDDFLDYRIGLDGDNLVASYVAEPRRITADTQIRHRRLSARTLDILRQERPDLDAGEMERKWRKWAAETERHVPQRAGGVPGLLPQAAGA